MSLLFVSAEVEELLLLLLPVLWEIPRRIMVCAASAGLNLVYEFRECKLSRKCPW